MMLKLLLIVFYVVIVDAQDWKRHSVLDPEGRYHLYWKVEGDIVVFQVEVATTGWVGFGISPNGGMSGADMVIGWVSDGKATFHDRIAEGKFQPLIDDSQDWELLWSNENSTHTVLRFQREIDTCDNDDLPIMEYTTRIIYAYSLEDPETADGVTYHGPETRGTKSLDLLQEKNEKETLSSSEDILYWNIIAPNLTIPDVDTSYLCILIKQPNLDTLHHMIKREAVVQPGNERFVHHMALYECTDGNETMLESLLGTHQCYNKDQVPNFSFCSTMTLAWAVGGKDIYLPENAGLPIGRSNAVYFVLEIHYDNPSLKKGIMDNSGLRITYTPKLRKYNAGVLVVGNPWNPCMFVPPGQREFVVPGHAHPSCLRQGIPADGIKFFSVFLHSHTAGKRFKLRHFRGRQELPIIISDDNYDFNYQNFYDLPKQHEILPNDHLTLECIYDSSKRNRTTFGGLSTREEMCLAFILYYPEVKLAYSMSCPEPLEVVKVLGVNEMSSNNTHLISPITGRNMTYVEFLRSYPWDDNSVRAVQRAFKYSPHINTCIDRGNKEKQVFHLAKYPKVRKVYQEPDKCQSKVKDDDELQILSKKSQYVPDIMPSFVLKQVEREEK